jgi:hypothetical protein
MPGRPTESREIDAITTIASVLPLSIAAQGLTSGHQTRGNGSPRPGAGAGSPDAPLWEGVSRLLDRAPSLDDLRVHQLELLALARWRRLRHPIPAELEVEADRASLTALAAPLVLQRVRDACDGPIVLLKGPEAAAYYPEPSSRSFTDLDILVPNAFAAQSALRAAGFHLAGEEHRYAGGHHLQPVRYPGLPLVVEVHIRPKWVAGIPPPPVDAILEAAVPSAVPVAGISALPRPHHALVMAAHAWAHQPLGNLRQLIDIAAALAGAPSSEAVALASGWGMGRIWRTTTEAIDALLFGARPSWPLRLWARNLRGVRDRTVLATHLERWLAGFSAFPLRRAASVAVRAMADDLRPVSDEEWSKKLHRTGRAVRNALVRRSQHAPTPVARVTADGPVAWQGDVKEGRITGVSSAR